MFRAAKGAARTLDDPVWVSHNVHRSLGRTYSRANFLRSRASTENLPGPLVSISTAMAR